MNALSIAFRVLRVDRRTRTSAFLTAVGVAVATSLVLLLLGLPYAVDAREERVAWQNKAEQTLVDQRQDAPALIKISTDRFGDQEIGRLDVALTGKGRLDLPPGVTRLPGPGESLVSPALAELIDKQPASSLGERFGKVVGYIGSAGLRHDDQLFALVGQRVEDMGEDALPISDFTTSAYYTDYDLELLAGVGLVVLLVPSLVLVASAARLTATRRERRLAAFRLAGATPQQVMAMVVAELAIPTVVGVVLGAAVNPLVRMWASEVPWDGSEWHPSDLAAPTELVVGAVVCLPLLVIGAAVFGLRRVVITPLGAMQRTPTKPLSWLRVLALPAALAVFVVAAQLGAGNMVVLGALATLIGSATVVGPWVTAAVGRFLVKAWRGPAGLLAGRRLHTDPKAAYRASSGVVLAVFVGAMALTLLPTLESTDFGPPEPTFAPSTLRLNATADQADKVVERIDDRLTRYGQQERAVRLDNAVVNDANGVPYPAYIGDCKEAAPLFGLSPQVCLDQPAVYGVGGTPVSLDAEYDQSTFPLPKGVATADLPRPVVLVDRELVPEGFKATASLVAVATSDTDTDLIRTAMVAGSAGAEVFSDVDMVASGTDRLDELRRITAIGIVIAGLLAGCSAAIATAGSVMDRRRTFGAMIAAGTQMSVLARTLRVEASLPAVIATFGAGLAGVFVGVMLLGLIDSPLELVLSPWLLAPVVVGVIVAVLAASVCGPALRRVRQEPLSDE